MRVVVIRMGFLCVSLVAGACVPDLPDLSEFDEFSILRINHLLPPFNASPSSCEMPDAPSIISASIHHEDSGAYSVEMEVFPGAFGPVDAETGDCPEDQHLWVTADGEEACAALTELPPRRLTDTEVGQMRKTFREVYLEFAAGVECLLGDPQEKCIATIFIWALPKREHESRLRDDPCLLGASPINDAQSSEILLFLEQLLED